MQNRRLAVFATLLLVLGLVGGGVALAQSAAARTYRADLDGLNNSGASGSAEISVSGNEVTVALQVEGVAASLPHAQHIHGALDGSANACPTPTSDADGDGFVSTPEGVPAYGGIQASLTTEGDTSADSALAVDRFPVAAADGTYTYERTFPVSQEIAGNIGLLHIVVHGIDINDNGEYDFDANGPSPLNPDLPFEATVPALCGTIDLAQVGNTAVQRLSGIDRIATAVDIARFQFPNGADTVFLTRADLFADAVAGGSLTGGPTLLVPGCGDLPQVVADEIARLGPTQIIALGGDAAICEDMIAQAAEAAGS